MGDVRPPQFRRQLDRGDSQSYLFIFFLIFVILIVVFIIIEIVVEFFVVEFFVVELFIVEVIVVEVVVLEIIVEGGKVWTGHGDNSSSVASPVGTSRERPDIGASSCTGEGRQTQSTHCYRRRPARTPGLESARGGRRAVPNFVRWEGSGRKSVLGKPGLAVNSAVDGQR
jgi:hypothetical protein